MKQVKLGRSRYGFVAGVVLPVLLCSVAGAATIVNGNFSTGDFIGWSLDTDGFLGGSPDFTIDSGRARIEADGSNATAWFANTLYQEMDTTLPAGYDLRLTFDWEFTGEATDPDEVFVAYLGDGLGNTYDENGALGDLLTVTSYGSGTFSTFLDPVVFGNVAGWTIEFQLGVGSDGSASVVFIDNVVLEAVGGSGGGAGGLTPVPEPGSLFLLASGLAGLAGRSWTRRGRRLGSRRNR